MRNLWLTLGLLALFVAPAGATSLSSAGWSAEIRAGRLVSLTNRLTGEALVSPATDNVLSVGLHRLGEEMEIASAGAISEARPPRALAQTAIWRGERGEVRARLRTRFAIELQTGDLLITQQGEAAAKGLYGLSWGLGDVRDPIEVLVPGNSGQRIGAGAPIGRRLFEYPIGWEAPFALLQGRRGGVLICADDPDARFKNLVVDRTRGASRMRFESRAGAPYEQMTRMVSSRWRLTAYRGGWQVGAALYRRRAERRLALTSLAQKDPAWAHEIALVAIMNLDLPALRLLANRCDPKRTLLYLPGWRRDGYDRNYPDYTPSAEFAPFVEEAHRLGFRVMSHVNYFGCDPKNPLYAELRRYQMRDPLTKEPLWWDWPRADPPIKFAYINPASREWRRLFVARMVELCRRYRVDALHLDQTLCIYDDHNGRIDGMNCIEGNLALHRELREALPEVALSGEGLNEITCRYEPFAQRHLWGLNHADGTWNDRLIALAHPISSAVLTPYTRLYGYLGMANPDTAGLYTAWQQGYERFGVLPTYAWPDVAQLRAPSAAVREVLARGRFFAEQHPEPDFTAPWRPKDLFVYRLANGQRAVFRRDRGVVFGVETRAGALSVLSRRIEGVGRAALSGSLPDWAAYDEKSLFGLDPHRTYRWSPSSRDPNAPHLSALPDGVFVARSGLHRGFARFQLDEAGASSGAIPLWEFEGRGRGGVRRASAPRALPEPFFEDALSGGTVRQEGEGLFLHPAWRGSGPGVTYAEFDLRLPDRPHVAFESAVHLDPGAVGKSDGVTFRVIATGAGRTLQAEVHTAAAAPTPLTLDLTPLRGQAVVLRIEADPGPAGSPTFDWGRMDRPRITSDGVSPILQAVEFAAGSPAGQELVASVHPESTALPGGSVRLRTPIPGPLIVPLAPPENVELPADLLHMAFESSVLFNDGIERRGYSYFRGQPGVATCNGDTRPALHLHPPSNGRSLADWWLRLPETPVRLTTAIGVRDGSKSEGVAFEIEVNGRRLFRRELLPSSGWQPITIDLSPWRGHPIVLTFVSDAMGDFSFDWAVWAAPRLEEMTR